MDRQEPTLIRVEPKDLEFRPHHGRRDAARARAQAADVANAFAWRIGIAVGAGVLVALLAFNAWYRRQARRDAAAITAAIELELAKGQRALERQVSALAPMQAAPAPTRARVITDPCEADPWRCRTRAAQTLSKCIDRTGATLFTSGACPAGYRVVRETVYVPEPDSPRRPIARPQPVTRRATTTFHTPTASETKRMRCDAAKARRESVLRAAGLSRTYDLLSRLDAYVHEACK